MRNLHHSVVCIRPRVLDLKTSVQTRLFLGCKSRRGLAKFHDDVVHTGPQMRAGLGGTSLSRPVVVKHHSRLAVPGKSDAPLATLRGLCVWSFAFLCRSAGAKFVHPIAIDKQRTGPFHGESLRAAEPGSAHTVSSDSI